MLDKRFHKISKPLSLGFIAKAIDCELDSAYEHLEIECIKSLDEANSGSLTFLSNKKYLAQFKETKATSCIVPMDLTDAQASSTVLLRSKNPYYAYAKALDLFYSPAKNYSPKISSSAYIAETAKIGKNCYIGHNVVIEDNVVVGDDCIIEAGTFIDCDVVVGNRAKIYSNVSISFSIIGDDVVILAGARIGQDGFGFASFTGVHHKIYHSGIVRIGNNVEIGANTTIDRGSLNDTVIEDLCRIDNLVQIGHNVQIGKGSIIVAQVGIAGSSKVGKYCALGGQVGVSGHLTIADKVQIAGQGGVIQNITQEGVILGGTPTVPLRDWHKQSVIMKKLTRDKNAN
jgi:UDP-3-O-[3-hydroxymyristoyl] glucosamine N-acyltransferase